MVNDDNNKNDHACDKQPSSWSSPPTDVHAATTFTATAGIYQRLVDWIHRNGGLVHDGLELRSMNDDDNKDNNNRGIFATRNISSGECLIQLPRHLAIDGCHLPSQYDYNYQYPLHPPNKTKSITEESTNQKQEQQQQQEQRRQRRRVSPWLRCLAAYYQQAHILYKRRRRQPNGYENETDINNKSNSSHNDPQRLLSKRPYLDSLPRNYETVSISWSQEEIDTYLDGTSCASAQDQRQLQGEGGSSLTGIAAGTSGSSQSGWKSVNTTQQDNDEIRQRYYTQIRPYLEHVGILEPISHVTGDDNNDDQNEEIQEFLLASQCLSTRCFHLQPAPPRKEQQDDNDHDNEKLPNQENQEQDSSLKESAYTGPYLLPWIDLLNHACSANVHEWNASLSQTPSSCSSSNQFCVYAERDIRAGEQVCHSYGDDLTACQSLQTFGFVDGWIIQKLAQQQDDPGGGGGGSDTEEIPSPTPIVLSKGLLLESCWQVIESDFPKRLAQIMQQEELEDEIWEMPGDYKSRNTDFLPNEYLIHRAGVATGAGGDVGNDGGDKDKNRLDHEDALVTLLCLPFLPICAYREAARSLLSSSMLDDYYLGHLVAKSLLVAIHKRKARYTPITYQGKEWCNDQELLKQILSSSKCNNIDSLQQQQRRLRAMYGLALRLDEQASLNALKRQVLQLLANLQQDTGFTMMMELDHDDHDDGDDYGDSKKRKVGGHP